ncbi:hypothetical protein [Stutzerimonas stutzeri]|uniref:hypothetical protein n=1 Tax=Stutzerimonas stutzeri TaxID=316 RepID=UPI00210B475A|nr:hypothetical protein [Stutzerimonas stutzeri]MCQ4261165.1 hypothetical protein [Stutzerimonas stutzeri]
MVIMNRFFMACLLAVCTTSSTAFLLAAIGSLFDERATIGLAFLFAAIAAIVSVITVAVWVVPIHLMFVKFYVVGLGWYIILSLVPGLVFPILYSVWAEIDFSGTIFAGCLVAGILSSVVFWYVAVSGQSK